MIYLCLEKLISVAHFVLTDIFLHLIIRFSITRVFATFHSQLRGLDLVSSRLCLCLKIDTILIVTRIIVCNSE